MCTCMNVDILAKVTAQYFFYKVYFMYLLYILVMIVTGIKLKRCLMCVALDLSAILEQTWKQNTNVLLQDGTQRA